MANNNTLNGQPGKNQTEEKKFKVIFEGYIDDNAILQEVKQKIASLFKVDMAGVETIFNEAPRVLKSNLPLELAYKYKIAFEETGALCVINEMGESTPAIEKQEPQPEPPPPEPEPPPPALEASPPAPEIPPPAEAQSPPPAKETEPPPGLETLPPLEPSPPPKEVPFSPKTLPGMEEPPEVTEESPPAAPEPPPGIETIPAAPEPPPAVMETEPPPGLETLPPLELTPPPKEVPFSPKKIPEAEEPPPAEEIIPTVEPEPIPPLEITMEPPATSEYTPPLEITSQPPATSVPTPPLEIIEGPPSPAEPSPYTPEPPPPIDPFLPEDEIPPPAPKPPGPGEPIKPGDILPKPGEPAPPGAASTMPGTMPPFREETAAAPAVTPHVKIPEIKRESSLKRLLPLIVILGILIVVVYFIFRPGKGGEETKAGETLTPAVQESQPTAQPEVKEVDFSKVETFNDPNGYYSLSLPEGYTRTDASTFDRSKIDFFYPDRTSISIVARRLKEEWKAEDEMTKKVKEIEGGTAGTLSLYTVTNYKLINIGDASGYELMLKRAGILSHYYHLVDPGKNAVSITLILEGADRQEKHDNLVRTITESLEIF